MVRSVAWSHKGTLAEVEVLCANSINLSIIGCISAYGLIAISQQVPKSNGTKKQKVAVGNKRKNLPHGTNSTHFLLFVEEMASLLNKLIFTSAYMECR
jgi:hypothetical protein